MMKFSRFRLIAVEAAGATELPTTNKSLHICYPEMYTTTTTTTTIGRRWKRKDEGNVEQNVENNEVDYRWLAFVMQSVERRSRLFI